MTFASSGIGKKPCLRGFNATVAWFGPCADKLAAT